MPSSLRRLFATILVYCNPSNLKDLWNQFEDALSKDFFHVANTLQAIIRSRVLHSIGSTLESMGRKIEDYHFVDKSILLIEDEHVCKEILMN